MLRRWDELEAEVTREKGRSAGAIDLMQTAQFRQKGELPTSLDGLAPLQRANWLWLGRRFAEADLELAKVREQPLVAERSRFLVLCDHYNVLARLGRNDEAEDCPRSAGAGGEIADGP